MGNKKKKKSKRVDTRTPNPYESVGLEISPDSGIIQASQILDIAAFAAQSSGNVKDMVLVSTGWLQMTALLAGVQQVAENQEQSELSSNVQLGFRGHADEDIEDEIDDKHHMGFRRNE